MAERRPLILDAGEIKELPSGDTLPSAGGTISTAFQGFRGEVVTSGQAISASTSTDIIFDEETYDTDDGFDAGTGIYTVPAALNGKYMTFGGNIRFTATESGTVYINHSVHGNIASMGFSGADVNVVTGPVLVATGDQIKMFVFLNSAANTQVDARTNFSGCVIQGSLILGEQLATPYTVSGHWFGERTLITDFTGDTAGAWVGVSNTNSTISLQSTNLHGMYDGTGTYTVPANVSKIRLKALMVPEGVPGDNQLGFMKNGSFLTIENGGAQNEVSEDAYANGGEYFQSAVLDVVPGDTFQVAAFRAGNTAIYNGWFEIEPIEHRLGGFQLEAEPLNLNAHKFWRVRGTTAGTFDGGAFAKLTMKDINGDAVYGRPFAGSEYSASNTAFIGIYGNGTTEWWGGASGAVVAGTSWLAQEFGAKVELGSVEFIARFSVDSNQMWDEFVIEWSDDGTTWNTLQTVDSSAAWSSNELKAYNVTEKSHVVTPTYLSKDVLTVAGTSGTIDLSGAPATSHKFVVAVVGQQNGANYTMTLGGVLGTPIFIGKLGDFETVSYFEFEGVTASASTAYSFTNGGDTTFRHTIFAWAVPYHSEFVGSSEGTSLTAPAVLSHTVAKGDAIFAVGTTRDNTIAVTNPDSFTEAAAPALVSNAFYMGAYHLLATTAGAKSLTIAETGGTDDRTYAASVHYRPTATQEATTTVGGSVNTTEYRYATGGGAPASGTFTMNSDAAASVTTINIHKFNGLGNDIGRLLELLLKSGNELLLQKENDSAISGDYTLDADAVDNTTYFTVTVTFVSGSGSFGNNDNVFFTKIADAGGGGGATDFLSLTDTPANYTSVEGLPLRANAAGTALEFFRISALDIGYGTTTENIPRSGTTVSSSGFATKGNFLEVSNKGIIEAVEFSTTAAHGGEVVAAIVTSADASGTITKISKGSYVAGDITTGSGAINSIKLSTPLEVEKGDLILIAVTRTDGGTTTNCGVYYTSGGSLSGTYLNSPGTGSRAFRKTDVDLTLSETLSGSDFFADSWAVGCDFRLADDALMPKGGVLGQIIKKNSSVDFDYDWVDDKTNQAPETATTYTVVDADLDGRGVKPMAAATAITITVPTGLTGTEPCTFIQDGVGVVTFEAAIGVTIKSAGGALSISSQNAAATLIPDKSAADTFWLVGAIV